jgi:adenylate cyclase
VDNRRVERRLAAILAADVAGYSRLMGADEVGTLAALKAHRRELIDPKIEEHHGRIVKTTGDGMLVEFASVVDAVQCAVEVNCAMAIRNADITQDKRIEFRLGINVGDIIIEGDDIFGDGVNVAARLENLAEPGGLCISRKVRDEVRDKLDLTFQDIGEQLVKNIARPVRVFRVTAPSRDQATAPAKPTLALPDMPSIAVMPFQNLSGDPEQEYFADGIVDDITSALSRTGWLFVIARNSSFTYKGRAVDMRQVGRELGVRYVLEGSVRKAGGRVRITGQLVEAATGYHVWADRFEGDVADIFELQDRITECVVGAIEPSLQMAEIKRARAKPTDSLGAYDLYLQSLEQHYRVTKPASDVAVSLLHRALELDPGYSLAKALLADVYVSRRNGWGTPEEADIGLALAREAIATSRDDPLTLRWASWALVFFGQDIDQALVTLDRAVTLNPNSAQVLGAAGWAYCWSHQPQIAIDYFQRAMRLSPLDPQLAQILTGLGTAYLTAGQTERALPILIRAVKENPNYASGFRFLILVLTRLGRHDEARAAASRLLEIEPNYRISRDSRIRPWIDPAFVAEFEAAQLQAGLPE